MLPNFIIEQIRRKEREAEERQRIQPVVEIPLPPPPKELPKESGPGVVIIEII